MDEFWIYLSFYRWQLLMGMMMGGALAVLGIFVILRRMTFFGVTLSQAGSLAATASLFLGLHNEALIVALSAVLMFPLFITGWKRPVRFDAVLAGGLVFFAGLTQVLLTIGGHAQNHLVAGFFGDILTVPAEERFHIVLPVVGVMIVFFWLKPAFYLSSFDPDQARLSGWNLMLVDTVFYLLLVTLVALSIHLLGSFYSIAQLVLPALFALGMARSVNMAILLSVLFSVLSTLGGFLISFVPIPIGEEVIHLPTSSAVILFLVAGQLSLFFRTWIRGRLRNRSSRSIP